MYTFDCIVKLGHFGAGHFGEKVVRVRADNAVEAMRRAKNLPGVKKGWMRSSAASVLSVSMVR